MFITTIKMEDLKKLISSILVSCPMSMTILKLNQDYREQIGENIPFNNYGFNSLEHCLRAMPDILEVRGTGLHAEIIVRINDKIAHINKLVINQRPTTNRRSGNRFQGQCSTQNVSAASNRMHGNTSIQRWKPFIKPQNYELNESSEKLAILNSYQSSISDSKQIESQLRTSTPVLNNSTKPKISEALNLEANKSLPSNNLAIPAFNKENSIHNWLSSTNEKPKINFKDSEFSNSIKSGSSEISNYSVSESENSKLGSGSKYSLNANTPHVTKQKSNIENWASLIKGDENEVYCCSDDESSLANHRVPVNVQILLKTLVDAYENGLWCGAMPQIYKQLFKKDLDYEQYGYKSLIQMCMDLPHIFSWYRPGKGDFKICSCSKIPKDFHQSVDESNSIKTNFNLCDDFSPEPALNDVQNLVDGTKISSYPADVVHVSEKIPRQFLPKNIKEKDFIDVCVGEIYDPHKFWIITRDQNKKLDNLMDCLQEFYDDMGTLDHYKIPEWMIDIGLYCVTQYNGEYHRVMVINLLSQDKQKVKVFCIDYGTIYLANTLELYFLNRKFFYFPQQAIRASLGGIYPRKAQWPREAAIRFLELVQHKYVVAQILNIDTKKEILDVILADTSGDGDIFVNDTLVEEGYGYFTSQVTNVDGSSGTNVCNGVADNCLPMDLITNIHYHEEQDSSLTDRINNDIGTKNKLNIINENPVLSTNEMLRILKGLSLEDDS